MRKLLPALLVILSLSACSDNTSGSDNSGTASGSGASPTSRAVNRAEFGKSWPLKVNRGLISCVDAAGPGMGKVVFTGPAGTKYALNGLAKGSGRYRDIRPIWANDPSMAGLKIDISPLIDAGLKLCH